MTHGADPIPTSAALTALGWSEFYAQQLSEAESGLVPMRIATVHRARMTALSAEGPVRLVIPPLTNTGEYAVGDWVLTGPEKGHLLRRLERHTLLSRHTEGAKYPQLIAANVDTLFIVTSCNADLNIARLERYLAVANEAGTRPVVLLTKADQVENPQDYVAEVQGLQRDLQVLALNGTSETAAELLAPWCGPGQTVALVGSSGVGKSTLLNTLTGKSGEEAQLTGGIREDDAKGRHTTTSRSLHAITGGGLVIDTPGFRTLHVSDLGLGLDVLFAEIAELAPQCKFRNCTHAHEPGCAVRGGVASGAVDPARYARWQKLTLENEANNEAQAAARAPKSGGRPRRR